MDATLHATAGEPKTRRGGCGGVRRFQGRGGDNRAGTRAENDTPTIPQVAQCPFRAFDMSNPGPRPIIPPGFSDLSAFVGGQRAKPMPGARWTRD